jgi:hypothetical protein
LSKWELTPGWAWQQADAGKIPGYHDNNEFYAVFDLAEYMNNYDLSAFEDEIRDGKIYHNVHVEVRVPKSKQNLFFWLVLSLLIIACLLAAAGSVLSKKKIQRDGKLMREYLESQKPKGQGQNEGGRKNE